MASRHSATRRTGTHAARAGRRRLPGTNGGGAPLLPAILPAILRGAVVSPLAGGGGSASGRAAARALESMSGAARRMRACCARVRRPGGGGGRTWSRLLDTSDDGIIGGHCGLRRERAAPLYDWRRCAASKPSSSRGARQIAERDNCTTPRRRPRAARRATAAASESPTDAQVRFTTPSAVGAGTNRQTAVVPE